MVPMFDPVHPGEILREDCMKPLGLSVTETAEALGVSRKTLSEIVNGKASITPEVAVRLEQAFTNPPADMWLRLQSAYDLWHAKQRLKGASVRRLWKGDHSAKTKVA
jgi:addiction module HigA family antidote